MAVDFFSGQQPAQPDQQMALAQALMQKGGQSQQGQMVNGHYVSPGAGAYASQLGNALAGGMKMNQIQGAQRATDILNGGTGAAATNGFQKIGSWFGGLFGGGA